MTAVVQHIYTISWFGLNLYLKLNKNFCSNVQDILLVKGIFRNQTAMQIDGNQDLCGGWAD
jgi:hypothetical protein